MKRRRITKIFVHFIFFALSQSMGEISCTPLVFSYCQFQRQRVREKCQFIYCAASDATAVCYCRSAVFFLFSFLFLLAQPFNNQITLVRGCQFSWQSQIDGTLLMNWLISLLVKLYIFICMWLFFLFVFSHKSTQHEKLLSFI